MTDRILVTCAAGNVGKHVVHALAGAGLPVRAADVRPERLSLPPGTEPIQLDLTDPRTFDPALAGARAVFLLRPPPISDVEHTLCPFADRALASGVDHLVFLSVTGSGTNRLVPHYRVEHHLARIGIRHTTLRCGFFAQNLETAYRADIAGDCRIVVPAGDGRVAFVDVRDVGEAAAGLLAHEGPAQPAVFSLTGPEAITFDDVARILSEELGHPIRYEPVGALRYARHLRRRGLPLAQIAVQTVLHLGLRRGDAEAVDPALAKLLGRPPRDLRTYVRDHRSLWTSPAAA